MQYCINNIKYTAECGRDIYNIGTSLARQPDACNNNRNNNHLFIINNCEWLYNHLYYRPKISLDHLIWCAIKMQILYAALLCILFGYGTLRGEAK